ncbi:MAG: hypothetical protein MSC30_02320 [Gaiellaceae bacterium MAG52_C11]|nr:hypothetical protein [Candidatus Gaiellasilicea maunaloa]
MHEATPETPSVPDPTTFTGERYHPLPSAPRSGEAVTDGAVASYLRLAEPVALVLPALSVHVPETETLVPSEPLYVGLVHEAIPDVASLPVKATATERLYQSPESGGREGEPPVTCGGVASRLIETVLPTNGAPYQTVHVKAAPVVSAETVLTLQPCVCVTPAVSYVHETVTSVRNQPPQSSGPGEQ